MRQNDKEYAEALFALAAEENNAEGYLRDLSLIEDVIKADPEYISLLSSPAIAMSERLAAIREAFDGQVCENVLSFLMLLCENSNAGVLLSCIDEFKALALCVSETAKAKIISAFPLSDSQKKALCEKLEKTSGKVILPEYIIDKSLIGGIKVEVDGKSYDGSLSHRLRDIKDVISE